MYKNGDMTCSILWKYNQHFINNTTQTPLAKGEFVLYGDEGPVGIVHRDIEIMAHVETLSIPPYTLHPTLSLNIKIAEMQLI